MYIGIYLSFWSIPSSIFCMNSSSSVEWIQPMKTELRIFWADLEAKSAMDSRLEGEPIVCLLRGSSLSESTVQNSLLERMLGCSLMMLSLMLWGDCQTPSDSMKEDLIIAGFWGGCGGSCFCSFSYWVLVKLLGVLPLEPSSSKTGTLGDRSDSKL